MKKILLIIAISTQIVHSKKDETPALDQREGNRFQELLHRRVQAPGDIRRRGNLPPRNLLDEFEAAAREDRNLIVINAQNRLRQLRNGVFVIQNNIAAEEVAPLANILAVDENPEERR